MAEDDKIEAKLRELQGALSNAQQDRARMTATGKVDMVEHQALRQEVENLRKTSKDLQHELEEAHRQGRMTEDQLEDRNGLIEELGGEVEALKEALKNAEASRQKAEESRLQAESRAAVLIDKLERQQPGAVASVSGGSGSLLKGVVLGAGTCIVLLEIYAFSSGGDELFARLAAPSAPPAPARIERPVIAKPAAPSQAPAKASTATSVAPPKPAPVASQEDANPLVLQGRSDGNRIVEDSEADYALIALQGGSFTMGNRTGVVQDESPAREVTLQPYLIGRSEVSFALYDRFARATGRPLPSDNGWGRGSMPVINVSWDDAQALADWLSRRTGKNYRLPTEAEWEYAASGGRESSYWWGYETGENNANCFDCGSQYDRRSPAPVETFKVNPFGLHSTAGNVQEWVQDCYRKGYVDAPVDGSAVEFDGCEQRVARGGAFNKPADSMKRTRRGQFRPDTQISHLGFRLARDPD